MSSSSWEHFWMNQSGSFDFVMKISTDFFARQMQKKFHLKTTHKILNHRRELGFLIRFPLFWLSFHNLPIWLYRAACRRTINADDYLNIYFHPWEFIDLTRSEFGLPKFVSKNSGTQMIERFQRWIDWMKSKGYNFCTMSEFAESIKISD